MKTLALVDAIGYIDDDLISGAVEYKRKSFAARLLEGRARRSVLKKAAMFILALLIGASVWLAVDEGARASFTAWVQEVYESYILYRYSGESDAKLPKYGILSLPQGYRESEQNGDDAFSEQGGLRIYENPNGDRICFSYIAMDDGAVTRFSVDDANVKDVKVRGFDGTFFQSEDAAKMSTLTWMDTTRGVQFFIDGNFGYEDMVRMAESVG